MKYVMLAALAAALSFAAGCSSGRCEGSLVGEPSYGGTMMPQSEVAP